MANFLPSAVILLTSISLVAMPSAQAEADLSAQLGLGLELESGQAFCVRVDVSAARVVVGVDTENPCSRSTPTNVLTLP